MRVVSVERLEEFIRTWDTKRSGAFRPGEDAYSRGYKTGAVEAKKRVLKQLRDLIEEEQ